ncbi:MAG TPA: acyl-CoA synthetase, partial [Pseudonocardia sp.]|nr:acyl-CoA synthetase [Pseudonocardia sp.]
QAGPEFPSTWARLTPDKAAVIVLDAAGHAVRTLSYGELEDRSVRCAHVLRAAGLGPGDHLAVLMENRAEVFEVCWAAVRSGLYVTVVNTRLSVDEASYVVRDSGSQVLVTSVAMGELATAIAPGTPLVRRRLVVGGALAGHDDYESALVAAPAGPLPVETEGETMLYSSGTTGRPKGVKRPLTGGPVGSVFRVGAVVYAMGYDDSTVYLSPAPLYHAAPLGYTMAVHRLGGTVVVMARFDAEQTLRLIAEYRVSHVQFVPTMFVRLLRLPDSVRAGYDLSSLRSVVHAAAPCPVELKRAMIDWWGPIIWEYYAGTEGNGMTLIDAQDWLAHPGSVGRTRIGELHIVGEGGRELPQGETGTVYFSGGARFEYHGDQAKTESSYHAQGWSTLGDVGHLDPDGYLYLTDRLSHMIISGGVNIYPQETENVLAMHPEVADVAVIGVPDAEMGEQVKAVVQLVGPDRAGPALAGELIEYCRARLAHYKCPRTVDFTAELPRHENGKLYKRLLRDAYRSGAPPA